jgi:threonine dehydrogenase-like Zn-dependent dehydrogenase
MIGRQRGLEVHVLDRVTSGPKPQLVKDLGAEYHTGSVDDLRFSPDIIIECTGVCNLIVSSINKVGGDGILCLAGVSSKAQTAKLDIGELNRRLVLDNGVIFGTVNANRRHYELAEKALLAADRGWLRNLITRRVPVSNWQEALQRHPDDIKVAIQFASN